MGNVITAVCTVAAMSGQMTQYAGDIGSFPYTYIVNGANCSWSVNFDDPGAQLEVFNTTNNQRALEQFGCTLTTTGCTSNYRIFSGVPYTYYSQDFEYLNTSTGQLSDVQNFTYVLMPPVPEQPAPVYLVNNSNSVFVTTSQYSSEFGSALTGCVLSAGPSPYSGSDLPATLSSTASQNKLPWLSYAMYSPPQNSSYTIYLNQLNVNPNTTIDVYFVCYNGNGQSWAAVQYNQRTSLTLPYVAAPSSNAAVPHASSSWLLAAVAMTAAAAVVALVA